MTFSHVLLLSEGRTLYMDKGGLTPVNHFVSQGLPRCPEGYNVADWLLDIASEPTPTTNATGVTKHPENGTSHLRRRREESPHENGLLAGDEKTEENTVQLMAGQYATTFLTQFEILAGREWKNLKR